MSERITFPEWRKENEPTRYPFAAHASLVNAEGLTIVDGVFLDASLYPIGHTGPLYLSKAVIDHESCELFVGDENDPELCSGSFPIVSPGNDVALVDRVGRPAGILASEAARLAIVQSWGVGTHEFDPDATEFCATCCVPTPELGLRGVLMEDGELLTGTVWLVGSDGVVLRGETVEVPGPCGATVEATVVRVDVVGDPLFRRRLCVPRDLFATPDPVRKLRIIGPDDSEFTIVPDERGGVVMTGGNNLAANSILRLYTTPAGIRLELAGSSLQ